VIAYLDSSVVLRIVLGQQGTLREWESVEVGVGSALLEIECLRTVDRLRHRAGLGASHAAALVKAVFELTARMDVVELTPGVLRRAASPMPAPLGTLDAIHLATAAQWREARLTELVFATHDQALALAARASGFDVIGA
jgi:predicted nucleic acid-binding protein